MNRQYIFGRSSGKSASVLYSTFTYNFQFDPEPAEFNVLDLLDGSSVVSYWGQDNESEIKRWFEKRKLIVRRRSAPNRYEVVCDAATALLAKLTFGGAA